jgi:DNA polymerase-3 subunit beta
MKLAIQKTDLQRGLARLQAIVEKRNAMPILANVLATASGRGDAGSLELAATDLEVGIRGSHPAVVDEAGAITAPARTLFEVVRELPDDVVHLQSSSDSFLEIRCGRAQFSLAGNSADEYPGLPEYKAGRLAAFAAPVLGEMIERTFYAACQDEARYNLNGVFFEVDRDPLRLRMVATDGHRLALAERPASAEIEGLGGGVIIPRKGVSELKRLLDEEDADEVEIGFEGNSGLARRGQVILVMRLIEGEFPNYRQVIPKASPNRLTAQTEELVHALRRVSLFAAQHTRNVRLDVGAGRLRLSSRSEELGEAQEEVDVDYSGIELSIGFNARYLMDALTATGTKEVEIGLGDGNSPAQIRPAGQTSSLAVVMPMRI